MIWWSIPVVILVIWVLLQLKTSRSDGTLVKVHPYRRIMWYIMPTRNESVVYFDAEIVADELLSYLEEINRRFPCTLNDLCLAAVARGLVQTPEMDRFVVGHRLYQRTRSSITFSMKRQRKNKKSKLATVKQEIRGDQTLQTLIEDIASKVKVERSDKETYADKEFKLFNALPRPVFRGAFMIFKFLDYFNILPPSFVHNDPMYTSIFMANLGTVNMAAGYHHLYEYGTCPLFLMFGKVSEKPVVVDGELVVRKVLPVRFTFDERIDDGMTAGNGIYEMTGALERPRDILGCLAEDGSDAYTFGEERPRHWKRTDE